jgi:hypothetical protein
MVHDSKVNQVILIIFDDIQASQLFNLVNEGKLPNVGNIAHNGIKCTNCITSYPAITFPCYGNIITGSNSGYFPKEGNAVPLYHWLDRTDPPEERKKPPFIRNYGDRAQLFKINKDIGTNVKTIFEQAGEGNFLSVTSFLYRGSVFTVPKHTSDVASIFKNIEISFKDPSSFFSNKEAPKITVGYIHHTDDIMHAKGFDHPDFRNLIIECDKYIGSLVVTLKETGYYDETAIGIITDHGNYKAKNVVDLEPFFDRLGMVPYNPENGRGDFDVNFGSIGFFNFPGETWYHHPTITQLENLHTSGPKKNQLNIFNELWKIPGAKYMYYRDDNNTPNKGIVHIRRLEEKSGKIIKARIEYEGAGKEQKSRYIYENLDVYGYEDHEKSAKLVNNGNFTIDEWLNATNEIDFPIIIDQIPRYFKNPRSCDIIISTVGEYSFNYEHGKTMGSSPYSHDIGTRPSMVVPFIIGGSSNIPQKELSYCKTTDMVPSLLELLGLNPDKSVIGKSILKY